MCVMMSTVRINLHGDPQRKRLRASLSVATRSAIISRSVMSLCSSGVASMSLSYNMGVSLVK